MREMLDGSIFRCAMPLLATALLLAMSVSCTSTDIPRAINGSQTLRDAVERYRLTTEHTPWEILHGILARGSGLQLCNPDDERFVSAVDFICTAEDIESQGRERETIEVRDGSPYFVTTYGEGLVQGHPWQFLAKLSAAGVGLEQPVIVRDHRFTLMDVLAGRLQRIEYDALDAGEPFDLDTRDSEVGWIIETLVHTLPEGSEWMRSDGRPMSVAMLVQRALERPVGWGACGGTHKLLALAKWYHHVQQRDALWDSVGSYLGAAYDEASSAQYDDGSYGIHWSSVSHEGLHVEGWPDSMVKIYLTGHMLAWMAVWIDDSKLDDRALRDSYVYINNVRVASHDIPTYYDALSHAYEAMVLYEERLAAKP